MRKLVLIAVAASIFLMGALPLLLTPDRVYAVDAETIAENLDNYFVPAFPDFYGEVIDRTYAEEQLKKVAPYTKGLEIFGYIKALGDIANKIDGGDASGAAVDAALTACKAIATYLKDDATKKVVLGTVGISTAVVAGVFVTIDITRASYKAVEESKTALDLERLYYKIEADATLKTPNRKLGQGDPIRQDQQAVERIWRQVLTDKEFESLMKTYVTTELSQEWPEPTTWEKITTSSDYLREAKLLEDQKRIKGHIKGLLSELNKVAKKRESSVVLAQQLREISAMAAKFSPGELQKALEAYSKALLELPEVEKYLASFPAKAADLKGRYEKANPVQLTDIKKEIVADQVAIRSFAGAIRGFPTAGRMAGKRTQVLTSLKGASSQLNALYNSTAKSEIERRLAEQNKRIAEEAARLDTGGVDFAFKRYECKKTFDEVKGQFYDPVMKGSSDAEQGVEKAREEVTKHADEMKQKYEKDLAENQKTYNDASTRLKEEISRVQEAYDQATNPNEKNALYEQLQKLRKQAEDLDERFKKYKEMYASTSRVDSEECANAIKEISKFYEANKNRFAIALDSVAEQARNASDLYSKFLEHHGSNKYGGTQTFLAAEKIAELRKIADSAPPGYAGIDLKFLKGHIKMDKTTPVSVGLPATLKEMADALWKYIGATGALRMKYSAYDDTSTLPSLKFMESKEAPEALDNVLKAIDNAIIAHEKMDAKNIPEVSKRSFADTLQALRSYKKDIEEYRKLISLSSGLAGTMERYWTKAKAQNAAIDEDIAYLSRLWNRFGVARQLAEGQFAIFRVNAAQWKPGLGTTPPALTSEKVKEVLDHTDILGLSKQLQLGLETLIPNDFVEVKAKEGFISIRPENLNALSSKIQGAPVSDYSAFWKFLHGMRTSAGQEGFIMECYFTVGNNLWPLFDSNSALQASAAKLKDTFAKQRESADKLYSQRSMEDGQFGGILEKANQAIAVVKGYIANGQYDSAIMYYIVRDNLLTEYGRLGKKRADVDAALKGLADLIEQAKTKQVTVPQPALTQGIDQSQKVRELYAQFKEAYESKSVSKVIRCLSNQWSSGDGGTISDLQRQLQKTFAMFDEVRFTIQGLKIVKVAEGQYRVNYEVNIASKIYKKNLKHEEKSNIDEEVTVDQSGQTKILRTLGGRLLSVK